MGSSRYSDTLPTWYRLRRRSSSREDRSTETSESRPRADTSTVPRAADRSRALVLDIAIVTGVSLTLGLIRLGAPSVWIDESFTARATDRSFTTLVERQVHALYYVLLKAWAAIAGDSEWALRFPSVLAAAVACALLVVLGNKILDRRTALIAGLLLASNAFFVQWSQQARSYSALVALSLVATLVLLRALELNTRAAWSWYGAAFTVVVVWHPLASLLLVPGQVAIMASRRRRILPHGLLAAVIVGLFAVPWAAILAMRTTGENYALNWLHGPTPRDIGRTIVEVSGALGIGAALAFLGLVVLSRSGKKDISAWLGVWALAPLFLALAASAVKPVFLDRYLIVVSPAFALLAAAALIALTRRLQAMTSFVVVCATVVGLLYWYSLGYGGNWRGEDWRAATSWVDEHRAEADAVVVVPWWAWPAPRYYGARVTDVSTADAIWVLRWSETGDRIPANVRQPLGFGDHVVVETHDFGTRVSAQLWVRPKG